MTVKILALDTSSAGGSAALVEDGAIVAERGGDAARTHGERLPRELMELLGGADVALRAVDRFAVATGPGSFTGLRVGIATVQGLALAQRKLVCPVSSFEALAHLVVRARDAAAPDGALVAVWIDGRRGEVFACLYGQDGRTVLEAPTALTPDATLAAWAQRLESAPSIRFAGDGASLYADVIRGRLGTRATISSTSPMLAGAIGIIAAADPGRAVNPHAVVPVYVRRSDAELARDRRRAGH